MKDIALINKEIENREKALRNYYTTLTDINGRSVNSSTIDISKSRIVVT